MKTSSNQIQVSKGQQKSTNFLPEKTQGESVLLIFLCMENVSRVFSTYV